MHIQETTEDRGNCLKESLQKLSKRDIIPKDKQKLARKAVEGRGMPGRTEYN
jgi:hypothetical protein